ncbi:MAG: hypothetical protein ACRDHU_15335, partial [Actinomycetota bacterium]
MTKSLGHPAALRTPELRHAALDVVGRVGARHVEALGHLFSAELVADAESVAEHFGEIDQDVAVALAKAGAGTPVGSE